MFFLFIMIIIISSRETIMMRGTFRFIQMNAIGGGLELLSFKNWSVWK